MYLLLLQVLQMFEWLIDPCIAFVRRNCREVVPTSDIALPISLMNTFWSLLDEFRAVDNKPDATPKVRNHKRTLIESSGIGHAAM